MFNKKLEKRLDGMKRDQELADKSNIKLKLSPPIKWGPIHLYRRVLIGLTCDSLDILGREKWTPSGKPFGEHRVSWNEWNTRIKKVCPIQYYIREDLSTDIRHWLHIWKIKDLWYYYKCKFFKRYNVLHVKTLPPTWVDEDRLLVHSMFAVLERYMDEKPSDMVCFDEEPHATFWREINEVWEWWNKRTERQILLDEALDICTNRPRGTPYHEKYKELNELEARFEKEEEEMLLKLVKNRHGLWV